MSKRAEEAALKAYPVDICGYECGCEIGDKPELLDYNERQRIACQEGYELAEKDLALTWEDIEKIVDIHRDVLYDNPKRIMGAKENYEDTLKKFNEWR